MRGFAEYKTLHGGDTFGLGFRDPDALRLGLAPSDAEGARSVMGNLPDPRPKLLVI